MMSKLGEALRKQANDNQRVISYIPSWNRETGSVTATILLQQISFRFENNGDKPFYKFKEPCTHAAYKKGDSWTEELGFTRREFDTALENIGQKINKETPRQPDKLVWYWTNTDRLTRYELNVEAYEKMLERIYVKAESAFTRSAKAPLLISEITTENTTIADAMTEQAKTPANKDIPTSTNTQDPEAGIVTNSATTNVVGSNGRPHPPTPRPARKAGAKSEPHPLTKPILDAYVEVRGKNGINYGKESAWAKKIAEQDGTPEQVKGCYQWIKSDPWWEFKTVGLEKIYERLPEYIAWQGKNQADTGWERMFMQQEEDNE